MNKKNAFKNGILAVLISGNVNAESFVSIVYKERYLVEKLPWSIWQNQGGLYDCTDWLPMPSTVDLGKSYNQTKTCKQNQFRTRAEEIETRIELEKTSRSAVGTKNFITGTRKTKWSSWSDTGVYFDCAVWSPNVTEKDYGESFTQTRNCSQNQEKTRELYNVWADGSETLKEVEKETQTISEQDSQQAVGSNNIIVSTRNGDWSNWSDSGSHFNCLGWSPDVSNKPYGEIFTQTRDCSQNQTRNRNIFNVWADGSETLNTTETGSQTITIEDTQQATGTDNFIASIRTEEWSFWFNNGSVHTCDTWSPDVSTKPYGEIFTQTRDCLQDQTRTRTTFNVWADGTETELSTETSSQTISVEDTQQATGTVNFIASEREADWSLWRNIGSAYDCTDWSPNIDSIPTGQEVVQTRDCSQNQEKERIVYNVWADTTETVNRVEQEKKTVSVTENKKINGSQPQISIANKTIEEKDNDFTTNISITLDKASSLPVTINYTTEDISAIAGSDYVAKSGTLTFDPGQTSKNITLTVLGDYNFELSESLKVKLSNATNAEFTNTESIVNITNNDVIYKFNVLPLYGIVEYNDGSGWEQVLENTEYSKQFDFRYNPTAEDVLAVSRDIKVGSFDTDPSTPYYADGNHSITDWGTVSGDTAVFVENGVTVTTRVTQGNLAFANRPGTATGVGLGSSLVISHEIRAGIDLEITLAGDFLNDVEIVADGLGGCYDIGTTCETKVEIDAYDFSGNFLGSQGGYRQATSNEHGEAFIDSYYFTGDTAIQKFVIKNIATNIGGANPDLKSGANPFLNMTISRSAFEVMDYKIINKNGSEETATLRLNINEGTANVNVDMNDILKK
ncbi:MAG: hypothetical protein CL760_12665 [Chloroflexi bacterium]|nr:hypothetical protein [Chloroflexota bacterium]|tara:strand:+ start:18297 stop:20846 length:2550 start_codon:yes stop_codon:yes gene_type:complete